MSLISGLADYLVGVQAGFDTEALRPPASAGAELARLRSQPHAAQALAQWCLAGAVPRLRHRLTVGALRAASGGDAALRARSSSAPAGACGTASLYMYCLFFQ